MAEIVISEFMDLDAVEILQSHFDVLYDPELVDDPTRLSEETSRARALIVRNRTQVTEDLLTAGVILECVGRLGVGLDNIDLDACNLHNVEVYPAVGANNLSVAEYVITSAMVLLRGAYLSYDKMQAGEWPRQACSGREISGKTLGLVGFGGIAQQTATMAKNLGMTIVGYDPFLPADHAAWNGVDRMELDALLAASDVVSLHTPLTANTRHLINEESLSLMKDNAILINAARGGVVDEAALADALRAQKLGGAALDVFETEPLAKHAANRFAGMPNVLLTPHIAGVTVESNQRVSGLIADLVTNHLTTS
jgi:(S)-sulfolactate dehydrogenase